MPLRPSYLVRAGDALSQLANVLLIDGDANESISGRAHREGWTKTERLIDVIFAPWELQHCRIAYLMDVARAKKLIEQDKQRT